MSELFLDSLSARTFRLRIFFGDSTKLESKLSELVIISELTTYRVKGEAFVLKLLSLASVFRAGNPGSIESQT
jgi:hypothetical protein